MGWIFVGIGAASGVGVSRILQRIEIGVIRSHGEMRKHLPFHLRRRLTASRRSALSNRRCGAISTIARVRSAQ